MLRRILLASLMVSIGMLSVAEGGWREWRRENRRNAGAAATAPAPRDIAHTLPGGIAQRIEHQNSPQDKLIIDISPMVKGADGKYTGYVRIVWGDLDNLIQKIGKEYYSNWDGSCEFADAIGIVDRKIRFDDGQRGYVAGEHKATRVAINADKFKNNPELHLKALLLRYSTTQPTTKPAKGEPHEGSGRDKLICDHGDKIEWQAGVVGALDGLTIKVETTQPTATATIKAGKFTETVTLK